jgi:hypothetical protein
MFPSAPTPLKFSSVLLLISLVLVARASAIAINGTPTLPTAATLQLRDTVNYRVEVIGTGADVPGPNSYNYNVWVSGIDIYGNPVFIQVEQGTVSVTGPIPNPGGTPTAATVVPITGTWTVPNDGTLHNVVGGYRLNVAVYATGTPLPTAVAGLTSGLAVPLQTSEQLNIEVLPDIEIPDVGPIFKQPATASAAVVGGSVQLTVTNPGSGYDANFPPMVTVDTPPAGGTAAQFLAILEAETGSIIGFTTLNPGAGYIAAPNVTIAPPPSNMTQRTGGILYKAGTYYGGDIVRFQATVRNRITAQGGRQSRPLRSARADRHRLNLVLTTNPEYDEAATPPDDEGDDENDPQADPNPTPTPTPTPSPTSTDDFLLAFHDIRGDMAGAPAADFSTIRAVNVYGTPGALPPYGIAGPGPVLVGARNYTPMPDNGFLDIGEQVQIDFEVLMPKNYAGIYYIAARADSLDNGNFLEVNPLLRKTRVSAVAARITLLSGPDEPTGILSQVTAPDGTGLLQSNGASDRSAVDGSGRYAVFQSLATDLAIPQQTAANALNALRIDTGVRVPFLSEIPDADNNTSRPVYSALVEGPQQIYRRDLATREIVLASVSSGGGAGNGKSQNAAINRAPDNLAVDGRFIAFESEANNLVSNDINQTSDIFIRSSGTLLRTTRASINADGVQGNAGSYRPSLSGNGRFVAFESVATNLDLVNPVPAVSNLGSQIYVHDRDVSNSGVYDTPGNIRTYLVSLANDGSTRATASVAGGQIINGQVSGVTVSGGGSGYLQAYPPAVVIAPPPVQPGAVQATAEAVVNGAGQVTTVRIVNPGAGYNPGAPPAVTIAPRGKPAGDVNGNNGWNNQPRISDDGQYVTWVSYSSNLPRTQAGPAVGNNGWRGVVYRIRLQGGIPLTDTIEAVSVSGTGQLANLLAYEPTINADGSVIAFTSWANNLVNGDSNGVADVFARDYRPGINTTRRVSESQPRLAIGNIFFTTGLAAGLAPNNNPAPGDTIILNDGINSVNFVFGGNVPIGATASVTRDNFVRAVNNAFRAGQLNIIAGNLPSDRLRSVNTGSNETILDAADLLDFAEPTSNTPANADPFYSVPAAPPGDALLPGLLLLHTDPNTPAPNQPIIVQSGGAPAPVLATDGVTTFYTMASGYFMRTSGMRNGGRQAELDSGELDGVPLGSDQPSIDQSGDTIAFRSTMQTLDVFDRTFTDTNGIFRGELLRMLVNFSGNVYVAERDPATGVTSKTTRASVSRFGYRTNRLLGTPSSAASHAPSVSGNGRYVSFSSDSDNRSGLIFGPSNLVPLDTNELRDVFLHDRLVATDLPPVIENERPQAVLTEPLWLSGQSIGAGSVITAAVLATDADQTLSSDNVRFLVDGQEFAPSGRYGNYFTFSYTALQETASSVIQVRVVDNSGALNDTAFTQEIRFKVGPSSVGPTAINVEPPAFTSDLVANPSGIPTVGFPVTLSARVTIPFLSLSTDENGVRNTVLNIVRFYANGTLISEAVVPDGTTGAVVSTTWYPQSSGFVEITAVASTAFGGSVMTLASNTLPAFFVTESASDLVPGSPEAVAVDLFQTVLSRAPGAAEQTYYAERLAAGTMTPAQMVAELVTTQEYTNLQNRLFDFLYRLGTPPLEYTYPALLSAIRSNLTLLPATAVDASVTNPPTPYGATEGQATAAQQIVSSPAFNAAFPGIANSSNQSFVTWFRGRMALFGGVNHTWTDTPVWNTLMPASTAPQGAAVAFMTAYYAAKNSSNAYGPSSPYQFQLKATALRWLFTGVWNAPSTLSVTTQAQLNTFIGNLLLEAEGEPTWAWVKRYGLTGPNSAPDASPAGGGTNLEKYAFNMDPTQPGYSLAPGGSAGLPYASIETVNGLDYLTITYVRRKESPSVSYSVEFAWEVGDGTFTKATRPEEPPVSINSAWERVTVRDTVPTNTTAPAGSPLKRFGRVRLATTYWTPAFP